MNKEWSELNKKIQDEIKKKDTFDAGIETLLKLRSSLMQAMDGFKERLNTEEFSAIPFINANGYHSKTVAYSLFHVFRIEDIVVNSLIQRTEQVLFASDYVKRMNSPIITTGNELVKQEIADFSVKLNIEELYNYIHEVDDTSTKWVHTLSYQDTKVKMTDEDKTRLRVLGTVSEDENAIWLIDYWCGKDVKGLIQMPLSRHWIMHVEAAERITQRVRK